MTINITESKLKQMIKESIIQYINESEELSNSSCMSLENGWYSGPIPKSFSYFGDCKNTVDKDKMWDATQMDGVIRNAQLIPAKDVLGKLRDGDRSIPSIFKREIRKIDINDLSSISCAINVYQRILIIYLFDIDTHFFFDVD